MNIKEIKVSCMAEKHEIIASLELDEFDNAWNFYPAHKNSERISPIIFKKTVNIDTILPLAIKTEYFEWFEAENIYKDLSTNNDKYSIIDFKDFKKTFNITELGGKLVDSLMIIAHELIIQKKTIDTIIYNEKISNENRDRVLLIPNQDLQDEICSENSLYEYNWFYKCECEFDNGEILKSFLYHQVGFVPRYIMNIDLIRERLTNPDIMDKIHEFMKKHKDK